MERAIATTRKKSGVQLIAAIAGICLFAALWYYHPAPATLEY